MHQENPQKTTTKQEIIDASKIFLFLLNKKTESKVKAS